MTDICGIESLTVHVDGEPGENYGDLLGAAMLKAQDRLPGAAIRRTRDECDGGEAREEWFLGCGHAELAPVGTKIGGTFTFVRRT